MSWKYNLGINDYCDLLVITGTGKQLTILCLSLYKTTLEFFIVITSIEIVNNIITSQYAVLDVRLFIYRNISTLKTEHKSIAKFINLWLLVWLRLAIK